MTTSPPPFLPSTPDLTETNWEDVDEDEVLAYDSATDTYRATFDSSTNQGGLAIVSVVAAVSGTPPLELPPLYPAIDANEVESLVGDSAGESPSEETEISATYNGYNVTVRSNGVVAVQSPQTPEPN